jgi:hypothetical protein
MADFLSFGIFGFFENYLEILEIKLGVPRNPQ